MIWRSNASGSQVHGQFGAAAESPWPAKSGYVKYNGIDIPALDQVFLKLRYSKYSSASVPILIYLDDEPDPRATLNLVDQGDWNQFAWTAPIPLGKIVAGIHSLKFATDGQQYGVADLDTFVLAAGDLPRRPSHPRHRRRSLRHRLYHKRLVPRPRAKGNHLINGARREPMSISAMAVIL